MQNASLTSTNDLWYPGKSVSKSYSVTNDHAGTPELVGVLAHRLESTGQLENVLHISVIRESTQRIIWGGSIADFIQAGEMPLTSLQPNETDIFTFVTSMKHTAGNEYQGQKASFELVVGFAKMTPTPTPMQPSPLSLTNKPNVLGAETKAQTNTEPAQVNKLQPSCHDTPPESAPKLRAYNDIPGTVTLEWEPVAGQATYYLAAYGTQPESYTYGNPYIGDNKSTSYTVTGLSSGTYYFVIRAGNGCAPGPFSDKVTVHIKGRTNEQDDESTPLLVADNFSSEVLGEIYPEREHHVIQDRSEDNSSYTFKGVVEGFNQTFSGIKDDVKSMHGNTLSLLLIFSLLILLWLAVLFAVKKRKNQSNK